MTSITWTAPAETPKIGGRTFDNGSVVELNGETMVDFGTVQVDGKLLALKVRIAGRPDLAALVATVQREEEEAENRKAANLPGLETLRAAVDEHEVYADRFGRMMDDESNDGVRPPAKPKTDLAALRLQFPRAAAYLVAESYSCAANDRKAGAGEDAMKRLENGDEIEAVMKDMENWLPEHAFTD